MYVKNKYINKFHLYKQLIINILIKKTQKNTLRHILIERLGKWFAVYNLARIKSPLK